MEELLWLIVLPPEGREAVGFVDYDIALSAEPRLPQDEAYMRGWSEAQGLAIKIQTIKASRQAAGLLIERYQ
ncbi:MULTISPECIES: hypothetical protein [unclassified Leptolyngbya]|uniref:hypothetical protein n=1 Tax=unclassified Leptolyngbya TaxID=2650499 RepID=UPI00168519D0|nr:MULTISPECIES: hypothetical protein [unclassified Leptolyngbya]MBD1913622.1 hypothetical protein [Leptolyngbya sp. FACHB-8]MBD2154047.1 hypothetical protein [Leptolyngbya sp. FACHB-16]